MNFLYPWLLIILPIVAGGAVWGLMVLKRRRRVARPPVGTRLANTVSFADLPEFPQIAQHHYVSSALGVVMALVAALGAVVLAARPADSQMITPQERARDVVLCLDVSGSMYPVDSGVIKQFREIVKGFEGERVAMSWFNSSSVTLFPLTDDYGYIDETLKPLERQFQAVADALIWDDLQVLPDEDWPDDSGTLLGSGSSLPGDGLISCLSLFDDSDTERSRSVILATDNMVEGEPIFELYEALDMAADANVNVYALCAELPSISLTDDDEAYLAAAEEMEEEVERVGGRFFATTDQQSVGEIVESILDQTAGLVEGTPRRVIHDRPVWGMVLLGAGLVGLAIWGGWRWRRPWLVWLRRGGMVVLIGVMIWNPAFGIDKVKVVAIDCDVVVLVDTSASVAAEDWDGDAPRLEGIKADLEGIAEHHSGAHIAIVSFDSSARLLMPLSTDPGAARAAAGTLAPVPVWRASGSTIDSALPVLKEILERQRKDHPERARLVYYLGDGEQTNVFEAESFKEVGRMIDGGAVLGYGTAEGGKMLGHWETVLGEETGRPEYIQDEMGRPGISRIDEDALKRIAQELGVSYSHRTADSAVAGSLWDGKLPDRVMDDETSAQRPLGFLLAIVILGLLVWELIVLLGRAQVAKAARDLATARAQERAWPPVGRVA
ncbi:MAG: VWA domain-containing protein [Bifidobacteriaceae bacterium]|jgi:Mg-chelatase subunit ChlD|nr:VWA domain-containing protein [Bifidobacteriaceae bacterium]